MESRTAEVSFGGDWKALIEVASRPVELLSTFPYRVEPLDLEGKTLVRISFRRLLTRFEFEGVLEFTFNEPHVTYILKGWKGLIVFSFAALEGRLVARISADVSGERMLGDKLDFMARNSALAVARMAESHGLIASRTTGRGMGFVVRDLNRELMPHLIRYVRFHTIKRSFRLAGEGTEDGFTVDVENDMIRRVEYGSRSGSSIIEIGRDVLDASGEDFEGIEASGEYLIRVIG